MCFSVLLFNVATRKVPVTSVAHVCGLHSISVGGTVLVSRPVVLKWQWELKNAAAFCVHDLGVALWSKIICF